MLLLALGLPQSVLFRLRLGRAPLTDLSIQEGVRRQLLRGQHLVDDLHVLVAGQSMSMLSHELILKVGDIVVQVWPWTQPLTALCTAATQVSQDVALLVSRQLCYHSRLLEAVVLLRRGLPRLGV